MKSPTALHVSKSIKPQRMKTSPVAIAAMLAGLALLGPSTAGRAANVLAISGFESLAPGGPFFPGNTIPGWTVYGVSWGNCYVGTTFADVNAYTPAQTNQVKFFGQFTGSDNYSGMYQDNAAAPGNSYSASGWVLSQASDGGGIHGGDQVWYEVTFRDATGNTVLAMYRSAIMSSNNLTLDTWVDLPVTNQYDPGTYTITNTVTSLVAPPGAAIVRYQILFHQTSDNANGSALFTDFDLDQTGGSQPPVISNLSPANGSILNNTNTLSFTVTSPQGSLLANGISLVLNGADVSAQLLVSGNASSNQVSYANLAANSIYTGTITVTDANAFVVSRAFGFDTFSPTNFTWEAEDFDFNGGSFINNPVISTNDPNSYYGTVGTPGVDENVLNYAATQPHAWRPGDQVSTDLANDAARSQYAAAGVPDYLVGYFNSANWLNYTRNFPAGTYTIYGRLANGSAGTANAYLDLVTGGGTTNIGIFSFTGRGWNTYAFVPLTDAYGNLLNVTLSGQETLRVTSGPLGGGVNMNFFMLAPAVTALPPTIAHIYPDGSQPFQLTNHLSFAVSSTTSTVNSNSIQVLLNGTDVSSSLSISGVPTNWSVSLPVQPNSIYTAVISAVAANGLGKSNTVNFDTFNPANFTVESEDFDFNNGQFIDNPVPSVIPTSGSYYLYPDGNPNNAAVIGVDLTTPSNDAGERFDYRPFESCGTETNQDYLRPQFVTAGAVDFDVGWWNGGTWLNYTRTFPTNHYYIYGRLAGGGGAYGATLSLVTGGWGTTIQTSNLLGSFNAIGTGWQAWQWVPLLNNGQPVVVSLGGTNTLKMTSGGGYNANFLMLVAAPPTGPTLTASRSGPNIMLSFPTQNGFTYKVYYKNALTDATWSFLNSVSGDGSVQTVSDTMTEPARFYQVQVQ